MDEIESLLLAQEVRIERNFKSLDSASSSSAHLVTFNYQNGDRIGFSGGTGYSSFSGQNGYFGGQNSYHGFNQIAGAFRGNYGHEEVVSMEVEMVGEAIGKEVLGNLIN